MWRQIHTIRGKNEAQGIYFMSVYGLCSYSRVSLKRSVENGDFRIFFFRSLSSEPSYEGQNYHTVTYNPHGANLNHSGS